MGAGHMVADIAFQVLIGTLFVGGIGGIVYVAHRLTAPAAKRMRDNAEQAYYAGMMARGRAVALPRTWLAGGLAGHDWNMDRDLRMVIMRAGLAILIAFGLGVWLRRGDLTAGQFFGEALLGLVIVGGVFFGIRFFERRKVRRTLATAGDLAPRVSFKVVANAHGLFVPVGDRVLEGAWSDWTVTDVEMAHGKYGIVGCERITLSHRAGPAQGVPLIASTFPDGDQLLEVIAARVARGS
jgi:hypothetical protein